jgi:hypothetical protein
MSNILPISPVHSPDQQHASSPSQNSLQHSHSPTRSQNLRKSLSVDSFKSAPDPGTKIPRTRRNRVHTSPDLQRLHTFQPTFPASSSQSHLSPSDGVGMAAKSGMAQVEDNAGVNLGIERVSPLRGSDEMAQRAFVTGMEPFKPFVPPGELPLPSRARNATSFHGTNGSSGSSHVSPEPITKSSSARRDLEISTSRAPLRSRSGSLVPLVNTDVRKVTLAPLIGSVVDPQFNGSTTHLTQMAA